MRTELHRTDHRDRRREHRDDSSTTVTISIDRGDLRLTETPLGVVVALEDFATGGAPGHPALPVARVRIAAPEGTWPAGLTIDAGK